MRIFLDSCSRAEIVQAAKIQTGHDITVSATVYLKCLAISETPLAEQDFTIAGVKPADGGMTVCK